MAANTKKKPPLTRDPEKLVQLLVKANFTQMEIAAGCKVGQATISRMFNNAGIEYRASAVDRIRAFADKKLAA